MIFSRMLKARALASSSFIACAGFIVLAVWGWQVPVEKVLSIFLISVLLLAILIGFACVLGALFARINRSRSLNQEHSQDEPL